MTKLEFVTQQVDPDHPVLATALAKIRALAERFDEVAVLALGAKRGVLPANCRVRTFDAPTQALRGARYELALALERRGASALLAHMSPVYALLAAPFRLRTLLWYTQTRTNPLLERAVRHVDEVLTVDEASFPFRSPKVHAIGHGIDVARFACAEPPGRDRLRLVALGRYSPVKGYPELIAAARAAGAELVIHGSTETAADRVHKAELVDGDGVALEGPITPGEVPALLAQADALVSATRGGADKVVLEAGAACVPAFSPAPAFTGVLPGELAWQDDLAGALRTFAARPARERAELGRELRERVRTHHSLEHWADEVAEVALR
jgi:glycosyltransferase involved in cell wall biosynthesis